ncbi:hypothetical protein [Leuconostoc pseudomesenteroides]|uniref:hypothetical protein n=1 Tax=Leuconostoc pseudomesenteroides TaxID=33968 RepID=UPI0032DE5E56
MKHGNIKIQNLININGLPNSGKSTSILYIVDYLESNNYKLQAYHFLQEGPKRDIHINKMSPHPLHTPIQQYMLRNRNTWIPDFIALYMDIKGKKGIVLMSGGDSNEMITRNFRRLSTFLTHSSTINTLFMTSHYSVINDILSLVRVSYLNPDKNKNIKLSINNYVGKIITNPVNARALAQQLINKAYI